MWLIKEKRGALMARMVVSAPEYTKRKYNLKMLKDIEEYVASCVQVNIPVSHSFQSISLLASPAARLLRMLKDGRLKSRSFAHNTLRSQTSPHHLRLLPTSKTSN